MKEMCNKMRFLFEPFGGNKKKLLEGSESKVFYPNPSEAKRRFGWTAGYKSQGFLPVSFGGNEKMQMVAGSKTRRRFSCSM